MESTAHETMPCLGEGGLLLWSATGMGVEGWLVLRSWLLAGLCRKELAQAAASSSLVSGVGGGA